MSAPTSETPNASATTADFEFAALWEAVNYRAAIVREFSPYLQGHLLEVGAGIGQMSREFLSSKRVGKITCVEPDKRFAAEHARLLPEADLIVGTSADLPPGIRPDCIVSINVLEHIEHDAEEMSRYSTILRPSGGRLCILVPARPEIYAPLDRDFGHFRRYRKAELRARLEDSGFRVEQIFHFNLQSLKRLGENFFFFANHTLHFEIGIG